jgi:hypothetical protein
MNQKTNTLMGVTAFGLLTLTAITGRADDMGASTNAITAPPLSPYQPFTIGAEVGTTGFGGSANWRFSNHFGIGSGFDYFSYSYSGTIEDINFNARLRLMSEPATLNWYPWTRSSFHISVGALFNENHLTGTATGNNINLDGYNYSGTVTLDIKQQVVDPCVAIGGNVYFDRRHHVSLGGELGVAYTGDPRVSLSAPGAPDTYVQGELNKIHSYARDVQFWPVIKVSLNYSF